MRQTPLSPDLAAYVEKRREAIRLSWLVTLREQRLIAEDDIVVALTKGKAETHDGTPYNNTYCQVMRIADGRIAAVTEYMDTALIDKVFGAA